MSKPLFLFVGRSGSGKTTIANMLEDVGYKQLKSYTTRSQRNTNDKEHTFVTCDEFNKLQNLVAYTYYNGQHYGATGEQVDEVDIYVIDPPGVKELLQVYHGAHDKIHVIYFDTSVYTRINRMLNRHDSDMQIVCRLLQDEKDDWAKELTEIYKKHMDKMAIHIVDANKSTKEVYEDVLNYMEGQNGHLL